MEDISQRFSAQQRTEVINELKNRDFDVLIIGGGITGAGIALDAASRGLRVALVEKQDFAAGTSSRSTKLVHGGLRYLKQAQLFLVRKIGRERKVIHKNAPHIVVPEKMLLPLIKNGSLNRFTASLALWLYDRLAGVRLEERKKMLNKEKTERFEPLVASEKLKGGAAYFEYKTDDSRLTLETLKKAAEYNAVAINYVEAVSFLYDDNKKVAGIEALDRLNAATFQIKAKQVINATGVWVDKIRQMDNSLSDKFLFITKGVHFVVSRKRFPLQHPVYFDAPGKRMVFVVPRTTIVYIGTTDTKYEGEYESPDVEKQDIDYLIEAVNNIFPSVSLSRNDIISCWAGLRPLIYKKGRKPSELSRKDEILKSATGLISIAGGKLTGYRLMAKKVVNLVVKKLKKGDKNDTYKQLKKCQTRHIPLSGGNFPFPPELYFLIDYADRKFDEAKQTGITTEEFIVLFYRYGMNIDYLTEKAFEYNNQKRDFVWLKAEIWYSVNYEMTCKIVDFFLQRTSMLLFEPRKADRLKTIVADEMAMLLQWSEMEKQKQLEHFNQMFEATTNISSNQTTNQ